MRDAFPPPRTSLTFVARNHGSGVWVLALAAVAPFACGRSSDHRPAPSAGAGSGGVSGSAGSGVGGDGMGAEAGMPSTAGTGKGGTAGVGGTGAAGEGGATESCDGATAPAAPLFRLGRAQYENSVRDVFGDWVVAADALPAETDTALTSGVTQATVAAYHAVAHDLALQATSDEATLELVMGCEPGEAACPDAFIEQAVTRAFRRPATDDELADFVAVFENGARLGGGAVASGVRAVVEVLLQAPEFLYRVEVGEPLDADADPRTVGWARPTPYEMASRLSYLLWDAPPDDELLDAAGSGALREPGTVVEQAARLFDDVRARPVVRRFHLDELLAVDPRVAPDPTVTAEIGALMREETGAFVEEVTFNGGADFRSLFTARYTFRNGPLSAFYGDGVAQGDAWTRVEVNGRRGLLTQGAFLAATAAADTTFPTRRGRVVLERLLCSVVSGGGIEPRLAPDPSRTTREGVSAATEPPNCAGCHSLVNPVGFTFEGFDSAGRVRTTDNGFPVDTSGALTISDQTGPAADAVELQALIGDSEDAKRCYVRHWMTFAYGGSAATDESCSRGALEEAFASGNIRELVLALTRTDRFLYRPAEGQ